MLAGKKTYIVGIGGFLTAVGGFMTGSLDIAAAIQLAVTALLGMSLGAKVDRKNG